MNASSMRGISSRRSGRSSTSTSRSRRARVIEPRMCSLSGGVTSAPSTTQKNDEVGASSSRPCGVHSSASSAPCSSGEAAREHVRRVGQRLHAVERAQRRVLDERERGRRARRGERLDQRDAPARRG
jgi:hypothetical protein